MESTSWPRQALTLCRFDKRYASRLRESRDRPFAKQYWKYHCLWHLRKVLAAERDQIIAAAASAGEIPDSWTVLLPLVELSLRTWLEVAPAATPGPDNQRSASLRYRRHRKPCSI